MSLNHRRLHSLHESLFVFPFVLFLFPSETFLVVVITNITRAELCEQSEYPVGGGGGRVWSKIKGPGVVGLSVLKYVLFHFLETFLPCSPNLRQTHYHQRPSTKRRIAASHFNVTRSLLICVFHTPQRVLVSQHHTLH